MTSTADLRNAPRFDRTAAAILDAAAHVFSEQGTGANLAAVAAAAGVSRATLYRYYPNREALLEALAAQAFPQPSRRWAGAGPARATTKQATHPTARPPAAAAAAYPGRVGR